MDLFEAIKKRRDTRHFTNEAISKEVIEMCLQAAKNAPSVGLTEPSRFIFIDDQDVKKRIHDIFLIENEKAIQNIEDQDRKEAYKDLKLQGIMEAPLGMIVCSDKDRGKSNSAHNRTIYKYCVIEVPFFNIIFLKL